MLGISSRGSLVSDSSAVLSKRLPKKIFLTNTPPKHSMLHDARGLPKPSDK